MTAMSHFIFALLAMCSLHAGSAFAQELRWHDAATLEVEGNGWLGSASPFVRLPDSAREKVSEAVWNLSKNSAGIAVRFVTDADTVRVRWSLTSESLDMPHMPATGVSGVDLYIRLSNGGWRFIGNGRPLKVEGNLATFTFSDGPAGRRECLLYLPLYNGTKSLEIGVSSNAYLDAPSPRPEKLRKPVLVYGTSIAQGGCASRPGMAWTAILGRLLDRPVINLGFSGSGTMEHPVGEVLAELDPAIYVIDCIWNISAGREEFQERITRLVRAIRAKHPDTPILFVGQSHIRPEAHPTDRTRWQEEGVKNLRKLGVKGLSTVPGAILIGDDAEGTVDGVHMSDLGMERQARGLFPAVRKAVGSR